MVIKDIITIHIEYVFVLLHIFKSLSIWKDLVNSSVKWRIHTHNEYTNLGLELISA